MTETKIHIRLYVESPLPGAGTITLGKEQSHYLANVMRQKVGSRVALFNGKDGEWAADITEIGKRAVTLNASHKVKDQLQEPNLTLAFAPIKKARIDFMAQKATELGVAHLQPVYTRRTVVDRVKSERLEANAIEAAEQCERLTVPTISEPLKLADYLKALSPETMIMFCDEEKSGKPVHDALSALPKETKAKPWAILIGPEGGFDQNERDMIKNMPNTVVTSLGPRVLRADTAAMAAIALWQSALGDWN